MNRYDEWAARLDPGSAGVDLNESESEALDRISEILGGEAVWSEPPATLKDRILAQAEAEAEPPPVATLDERRGRVRSTARWWVPAMGAVAAAVVAFFFLSASQSNPVTYEIAGTDLAPEAQATVDVEPLGAGVAITLNITGLPPARPGHYYAGWLTGDDGAVPIGSFHWREGGIPIELWSGVDIERYPNIAITLQREGEPTVSSGEAVLRGQLAPQPREG